MSRLLLLASISPLVLAPYSFADDDDERREAPIIVTAPGPDRAADELIGNATAIDREEVLENLSGTLGDTLDHQPGVSTTSKSELAPEAMTLLVRISTAKVNGTSEVSPAVVL